MFQRTILRQSQAVKSVLSSYTPTAQLAIRRTSRLQPQISRPLARLPTYRFYSTENEAAKGEQKEAGKENGAAEAQEAEDPVKKELEEKKKEAADLKVIFESIPKPRHHHSKLYRLCSGGRLVIDEHC